MQTPSAYWTIRDSLRGSRCRHDGSLPTRYARSAWTPCSAEFRPPGHADGHGRTSPRCCGADYLQAQPGNPRWPDRDRFVISNGHGSMLLYSRAVPDRLSACRIEALKNFRQLGCATPGHPEVEHRSRHRDDDRPAWAGTRQRGRHGARRDASSPRPSIGPGIRDRRSSHLGVRGRRLPDGRNLPRGLLAGGHAGASAG